SIVSSVRDFIDRTTGIQTLAQMKGLADLVRQFGAVPPGDVLDERGYKEIYNRELLAMIRGRISRLEGGELSPPDCQIANARQMLERMRAAGVELYLVSGTDQADAVAEARILGYAHLFT